MTRPRAAHLFAGLTSYRAKHMACQACLHHVDPTIDEGYTSGTEDCPNCAPLMRLWEAYGYPSLWPQDATARKAFEDTALRQAERPRGYS